MVKRVALLALFATLGLFPAAGRADVLGISPGLPLLVFSGMGSTSYTPPDAISGTPGMLTIYGRPQSIQWAAEGAFRTSPIIAPRSLTMTIYLDIDGRLAGAPTNRQFEVTGAVAERDPVTGATIRTYSGLLLRGEVLDFGFRDVADSTSDLMDFRFRITGGQLASRMGPNAAGVTLSIRNSTFAGFDQAFIGSAEGTVGPVCGARMGDVVWEDTNRNGVQDAGEPGFAGVPVTLTRQPDGPSETTVTDASGLYLFRGLCAGTYWIALGGMPAGYEPAVRCSSEPGQPFYVSTCTTQKDSSLSPASVTLPQNNTEDRSTDFGFSAQLLQAGGRIWHDLDGDGLPGGGEPPLANISVRLYRPDGTSVRVVTAADGAYLFNGLQPASYRICVTTPANSRQTSPVTPGCVTFPLPPVRSDLDFGFQQYASIGDRVWHDVDGNRQQDPGEPGLVGWMVQLWRPSGTYLSTTTGADGLYQYDRLIPATYRVCVTPVATFAQTHDLDYPADPNCATVVAGAGQRLADVDFGYQKAAEAGGRVWHDADADGVQDAGEASLAGTKAVLMGDRNMVAATGSDGKYLFSPLRAGTYTICIASPPGHRQTFDEDFPDTPHCTEITIASADSRLDVHFGYQQSASIGDRVWNDQNADGNVDPEETGWADVIVTLTDPSGLIAVAVTDATGAYGFGDLLPETYTVCVILTESGLQQTYDADGLTTPDCAEVALKAGHQLVNVDFGYKALPAAPEGAARP